MSIRPAIVIAAYNRPHSFSRLLLSVAGADYSLHDDIPLVISIDGGGCADVVKIANDFEWNFGEKKVIHHSHNLGLREHILRCGDLTVKYEAIIMLEDDTVVSPAFYKYASAMNSFYGGDETIAQVSLYAYEYSELDLARFHPLSDGHDVYFMQWASSWGQMWDSRQWSGFRVWFAEHLNEDLSRTSIPRQVVSWPQTSWKKYFLAYLVETSRFVVYPYTGYATNYGDSGENVTSGSLPVVQSPIALDAPTNFRCCSFDSSSIRYDCYFQPSKKLIDLIQPELANYDYEVDLQGTKSVDEVNCKYVLSVRHCAQPMRSCAWNLFPLELNLALDEPGQDIFFGETAQFDSRLGLVKEMRLALWSKRILGVPASIRYAIIKVCYKVFSSCGRLLGDRISTLGASKPIGSYSHLK